MNIETMTDRCEAEKASTLLKALANPNRLMIVCRLIDGERSVGALADDLGASESLVSQHLALLRREHIVCARRDAQTIYYAIDSAAARAIVETLAQHHCRRQETDQGKA
ncbi:ArsR/SmtB family transcription factor [Parapedomonas caeni]